MRNFLGQVPCIGNCKNIFSPTMHLPPCAHGLELPEAPWKMTTADTWEQSTADTGGVSPTSPIRQQRQISSPPENRGPLLDLHATFLAYAGRRSASDVGDQARPGQCWPPDPAQDFLGLSCNDVPAESADPVNALLQDETLMLALKSSLNSEANAARLLAQLFSPLEAEKERNDLQSWTAELTQRAHGTPRMNWSYSPAPPPGRPDRLPTAWRLGPGCSDDQAALLPPVSAKVPPRARGDSAARRRRPHEPRVAPIGRKRTFNDKNADPTHELNPSMSRWTPPGDTRRAREGTDWLHRPPLPPPSHNDANKHPPYSRSRLLHDFRCGRIQLTDLYAIEHHMLEFALDQFGARFIQHRLAVCPPQEAWFARRCLVPHTKALVTDVFGNHIVQRLLENGTPQQRHQILLQLQGDILRFALQAYGCRVLQKALETLSLEDKLAFAAELEHQVVRCVEDQNGNHVIQKFIERLPPSEVQFVIDAVRGQTVRVAIHCYGCRVIQRILEHCPLDRTEGLLDEIMERLVRLAQDQYGNYVVQHVLRYGRSIDKEALVDHITTDLLTMSSHKFSSNVVEKCLEIRATPDARVRIIRAALGEADDPHPPIMQMVRDRYANYVVQRMLDVAAEDDDDTSRALVHEIMSRLEKHMPALRKFTYGKHIAAAIERLRKETEGGSFR